MNPEKRAILPGLAFRGFSSRYQPPALSEGFQDITDVAFTVRHASIHAAPAHPTYSTDRGA
jgi:hypothetical protein